MLEEKPQVGLALGGGAARGLAHIGVLSVLQEHKIPIDIVVGTSIGALIGAVYAAETDLNWLEKMVPTLRWDQLVDLAVPRTGFLKTEKLQRLVELLCKRKKIEDLDIIYRAVAVDIQNGEEVVISTGSAAEAALASAAIPGVFVPVRLQERLLVDGGIRNRVPVEPVKALGAKLAIGVDVGGTVMRMEVKSIIDIFMQTVEIMQQEASVDKVSLADVLIVPEVSSYNPFDLNSAEELIAAGRQAAKAKLPEIFAALEKIGRTNKQRRVHHEDKSSRSESC